MAPMLDLDIHFELINSLFFHTENVLLTLFFSFLPEYHNLEGYERDLDDSNT